MTISDPRVGQPDPKPLPPDLDRWVNFDLEDDIELPDGRIVTMTGTLSLIVNDTGDGIEEQNTDWSEVTIPVRELNEGITPKQLRYIQGRLELEHTQAALDAVAERLSSHDT